jgi:hypothetical protein
MRDPRHYEIDSARSYLVERACCPAEVAEIVLLNVERYRQARQQPRPDDGAQVRRARQAHSDLFAHCSGRPQPALTDPADFVWRETGYARALVAHLLIAESEFLVRVGRLQPAAMQELAAQLSVWVDIVRSDDTQPRALSTATDVSELKPRDQ